VFDLQLANSEEEAMAIALRKLRAMSPTAKVGAVHHTVPKFYLRRFARSEQLLVRVPGSSDANLRNIADIGVRDFYTAVVDADGLRVLQEADVLPVPEVREAWRDSDGPKGVDARLEEIFSTVEGWTATVLTRMAEQPDRPLTRDERYALTTFLSLQMVRGVRFRREIELLGEFYAKSMLAQPLSLKARRPAQVAAARRAGRTPARGNGRRLPPKHDPRDALTDEQLRKVQIRPHPNEHLRVLGPTAEAAAPHLFVRPFTLVELDRPLLITADEPVVVVSSVEADHLPSCFLTSKQRQRSLADAIVAGRDYREMVHLYTTRSYAVAAASDVAVAIDPRRALVLGPKDTYAPPHVRLDDDAAYEFADDLNQRVIGQAYAWVAAHPEHAAFPSMSIPESGPLVMACAGGSAAEGAMNRPPEPRTPVRLRRTDWQS